MVTALQPPWRPQAEGKGRSLVIYETPRQRNASMPQELFFRMDTNLIDNMAERLTQALSACRSREEKFALLMSNFGNYPGLYLALRNCHREAATIGLEAAGAAGLNAEQLLALAAGEDQEQMKRLEWIHINLLQQVIADARLQRTCFYELSHVIASKRHHTPGSADRRQARRLVSIDRFLDPRFLARYKKELAGELNDRHGFARRAAWDFSVQIHQLFMSALSVDEKRAYLATGGKRGSSLLLTLMRANAGPLVEVWAQACCCKQFADARLDLLTGWNAKTGMSALSHAMVRGNTLAVKAWVGAVLSSDMSEAHKEALLLGLHPHNAPAKTAIEHARDSADSWEGTVTAWAQCIAEAPEPQLSLKARKRLLESTGKAYLLARALEDAQAADADHKAAASRERQMARPTASRPQPRVSKNGD